MSKSKVPLRTKLLIAALVGVSSVGFGFVYGAGFYYLLEWTKPEAVLAGIGITILSGAFMIYQFWRASRN